MKTSSAQVIFFVGVWDWILRFVISLIVRSCIAFAGPMPFMFWSSFREQSKSLFKLCSLIRRFEISITFSFIVPVLNIIARSSESVRISGPCFRNFSLGRSWGGRSFIFICLVISCWFLEGDRGFKVWGRKA